MSSFFMSLLDHTWIYTERWDNSEEGLLARKTNYVIRELGALRQLDLWGAERGWRLSLITWPMIQSTMLLQWNSDKNSGHWSSMELIGWWTHWYDEKVKNPDCTEKEQRSSCSGPTQTYYHKYGAFLSSIKLF